MSVLNPELIRAGFLRAFASRILHERNKFKLSETSFDRLRSARYYTSANKMMMFILACGMAGALLVVSTIVGKHKRSREKDQPYECGIRPTGDAREPVHVQFYMVALLFILFDIEAIFLYPWALVYSDLKVFGFVEMVLYIAILLTGYIYLWKKGALDWSR
jgi:NADH-quinone oxidoreductase subunit A